MTSDPVDMVALARHMRRQRADRGLSLRAAADECGVPFNTLSRAERGHLPDVRNFLRIMAWLGLPPEWVLRPARVRPVSTADTIAEHLHADPALSERSATRIDGLVRELYAALAQPVGHSATHVHVADTVTPAAARLLGDILGKARERLEESHA